jgi:hypothetical protein
MMCGILCMSMNSQVKVRTSQPGMSLDITQYTILKNCIDVEAECKPHSWNLRRYDIIIGSQHD